MLGIAAHTNPCGSELARDSGGSVANSFECKSVIASKLAPTVLQGVQEKSVPSTISINANDAAL
jgi:hypothetical protein